MKSTLLTELPIAPVEYEADNLNNVDWSKLHSLMSLPERKLVNGLIRYYHPKHILELGVHRGGGTVNILNAINDWPDSTLTSIDLVKKIGSGILVGDDAKNLFPDLPENKWQLFTGKDPSEVMDSLGKTFDFVVIDTAHLHPIESLNFLCVLPYLNDGAVVVLHDIMLFLDEKNPGKYLAPRILFSSVASPKIELDNIGVFQITPDTRKYISNVFDALLIPWETYPGNVISFVRKLLESHYSVDCIYKFDKASDINEIYFYSGGTSFSANVLSEVLNNIPAGTIFYGAGQNMDSILHSFEKLGIPFDFPIWDQDSSITEIHGHPVTVPDFNTQVNSGSSIAVITQIDKSTFNEVRICLESLGYTVVHKLGGLFKSLVQQGEIN